jgi:hypothetical protein
MNRMERRIAGKNGARPGAPVCRPGTPQNNVGMLGRGSTLYQSSSQRKSSQNVRQINGLEILQNQGDRISRLELKIEQLEQMNIMNISRTDAELKNKDKTIDLMNKGFRTTMNELRGHINKLQTKIKHLNGDIPIVKAVKKETKQEPSVVPLPPGILEKLEGLKQENITLEITET